MWKWALRGIRKILRVQAPPPRRSPWVLLGDLPSGAARRCGFCGRAAADLDPALRAGGEAPFGLAQARNNPAIRQVVCLECQRRQGMAPA